MTCSSDKLFHRDMELGTKRIGVCKELTNNHVMGSSRVMI